MKLKDTGLTAADIKAKVKKYMIETYERFDFLAETAKDQYMYDENGTPYLDFYAGIAVNSAGNCNEKVVKAVQDQCADIMQTFNYPYTIPQALLAEKVCTTIGMDKIFFQSTGTEANEAMIKMARKYGIEHYGPNKYHIVTAKMGFHGRTFGAMSATGQPGNACQVGFGPMTYGFSYAPYNDLEAFKDACTENTIAIMLEPVQGEGGVHPATKEFMVGLRKFCDENGMLLLIDEVQTGWCRTGKVMSFMHYGIKPDIVSMAKALGGGMPIGAICAREEVAKAFTMGSHGSANTSRRSSPSSRTSRKSAARACSSAASSTTRFQASTSSTAASIVTCSSRPSASTSSASSRPSSSPRRTATKLSPSSRKRSRASASKMRARHAPQQTPPHKPRHPSQHASPEYTQRDNSIHKSKATILQQRSCCGSTTPVLPQQLFLALCIHGYTTSKER